MHRWQGEMGRVRGERRFFHILGMSSSQLTNMFQRDWNHQPECHVWLGIDQRREIRSRCRENVGESWNTFFFHFSVQWMSSATSDSQEPSHPVDFLFWNIRHRFVRYYWQLPNLRKNNKIYMLFSIQCCGWGTNQQNHWTPKVVIQIISAQFSG